MHVLFIELFTMSDFTIFTAGLIIIRLTNFFIDILRRRECAFIIFFSFFADNIAD